MTKSFCANYCSLSPRTVSAIAAVSCDLQRSGIGFLCKDTESETEIIPNGDSLVCFVPSL